jgi:thiosulfate reductase cytochrome b subunit
MTRQRVVAIPLLILAFLALVASHAFPFLDDLSGLQEAAIAFFGAACALAGVGLWLRKAP